MEQTETACRQTQLYDLLSKLRRYNRKMIFKGSKLKRPRVSHHPRRSTMMRPRQVNKASVAGINRVQPNHHRKVITKLLKIDQCVASLKMLVVMQRQPQDGVLPVGAKKIGSPQLIAGTKQINHQTGDGAVGDDLLGQRKPGMKIAGVLIRCSSSNQSLQVARGRRRQGKGPDQPGAVELLAEIKRGN